MTYLISAESLADEGADCLFDCSFSLADAQAGRAQFEQGHIPDAVYVDLNRDLSEPPDHRGRHPMPDRETFAQRVRALGVNQDSKIVCYDQDAGAFAARLWWMLRWLGHSEVYLLDGGRAAWEQAGLALTTDISEPEVGNFEATEPLTRLCDASQLPDANRVLLDARDERRFKGIEDPVDPVAGHIPGAICATFTGNLAEGRFLGVSALRQRFESLGVIGDTVCYCGSGVTATHNILALLEAGFDEPALYPDSWSGWITDPSRPIARG